MSQYETCGQRMTRRRVELRLAPDDVAERVKIQNKSSRQEVKLSVAAYEMYEQDALDLSLKTVEKIAAALCVEPGWLAFGIGSSPPAKVNRAEVVH
jgi:hypothetical protein